MDLSGSITGLLKDAVTGRSRLEIEVQDIDEKELLKLIEKPLNITLSEYKAKRSKSHNAFFWECVGLISKAILRPKMEVYLSLIKDYGVYEVMEVRENAYAALCGIYKLCEVVSAEERKDGVYYEVLCYKPTHEYTRAEFQKLCEGAKQELQNLGIERKEKI